MRPGSIAAMCRWLMAPTVAPDEVCRRIIEDQARRVVLEERTRAEFRAELFLVELKALKSRYTGTMCRNGSNQEPSGMCLTGS